MASSSAQPAHLAGGRPGDRFEDLRGPLHLAGGRPGDRFEDLRGPLHLTGGRPGDRFEDLRGLKALGDKPFSSLSSTTCVTRKVLHSSGAPSFSSYSPSSSSSSSPSCSCSCKSLSSVRSVDARKDGKQEEVDADQHCPIGCGDGDDDDCEEEQEGCWGYYGPRQGGRIFPPPIKQLAKLEKSPRRIPRVFKRSYEDGGRLVIRELKVRHHEYFRARRENGRLTLKLIHMDEVDDVDLNPLSRHHQDQEQDEEEDGEEGEEEPNDESDAKNPNGRDDDQKLLPEIAPPPTSLSSSSSSLSSPPLHTRENRLAKTQDPGDDAYTDKTGTSRPNPDVRPWTTSTLSVETLSSSMLESTPAGGAQGVCFANGSRRSFFDEPVPMVHLVRS